MYIVDWKRTPVGKFLGALAHIPATQLTKPLFSYFLENYPYLKKKTDEVIIGNVIGAGIGMNPARIAAITGGMSYHVPAYTINHACASGMNAVVQGFRAIRLGDAHMVLAGGMESMSQAPFLVKGIRTGIKFGSTSLIDSLHNDGFYCCLSKDIVGVLTETLSKKYSINRKNQDLFTLASHHKAVKAQEAKNFADEIIPVGQLQTDEAPRKDTSLEKLSSLKPAFKPHGTITAGNASSLNDGAALTLLASRKAVQKYELKPMAQILDAVFVGLKPELMGMGPQIAIKKLLQKNKLTIADIDVFEINEAFAVQVLAVLQTLDIDESKLNINGGALAIGHPLGMSGTRIIGSLITALKQTGGKLGIASLCVGGGQGAAILIKNL